MSRLRVAAIVEGDGEFACIRILLERLWREMVGGEYIQVLQPIRRPRGQIVKKEQLKKFVEYAWNKLNQPPNNEDPTLVLILIDADDDCPARLGPQLLDYAKEVHSQLNLSCVIANKEYESWFVAAAESLVSYLDLPADFPGAETPEKSGKGWVKRFFKGAKYSKTQDQPAMTRAMNLRLCRDRSPSFDKLCRDLERLI